MPSTRSTKRYSPAIPIRISWNGHSRVLVPSEISVNGCYFRYEKPDDLSTSVVIEALADPPVKIEDAEFFARGAVGVRYQSKGDGFGFRWTLPAEDASRLQVALDGKALHPTQDAKVKFLAEEMKCIISKIGSLEDAKSRRFKTILLLIIAYMTFLGAPYKFLPGVSREFMGFYAVTGIWLSVAVIVYLNRFLGYIGSSYRRKALYYKALNQNRAYVFRGDRSYFDNSIFPIGINYDSSRAWSYSSDDRLRRIETYPAHVRHSGYPPLYFFFLELLFVGGFCHFLGIILRTIDGGAFVRLPLPEELVALGSTASVADSHAPVADVFSGPYFRTAVTSSLLVILGWIQIAGNRCLSYHRAVWEAKRITVRRPNPRATGAALHERGYIWRAIAVVQIVLGVYALSCLPFAFPGVRESEELFVKVWFSVPVLLLAVGIFFAAKILYIYSSLSVERDADKDGCVPVETR